MYWARLKQDETSWKPFVVKSFKANGEFDRVDLRRWGKATESCEKAMRTMENLWGASLNVLSRLISWTLAEISTLDGVSDGAPSTWWTMKTMKDTSWHIVTLTHGFVIHSHVMWIWSESRIRCSVNRAFDPIYWPAPSQEFNQYTRYTYSCKCEQLSTGLRPKGAKTILMGACFIPLLVVYTSFGTCTSSTAQGGGGSFKNGKPIGEVSWCDAKMAERTHWWIERWLRVSPFLSLFLSFSLCLSFAIYLQSYLSSHLPIYLSIHVSIDRFVYSPIY